MAQQGTKQLGKYILKHCPLEANRNDLPKGESPVDVAIRVMGRMADGIDSALNELGWPAEGHPTPLDRVVGFLGEAYGLWGQGLDS